MTVALRLRSCFLVAAALLLLAPRATPAPQDPDRPEPGTPAAAEPVPADPLGRGSPREAIRGYLEAVRAREYERAAGYLDLSRVAAEERAALGPARARELRLVLDRLLWVEIEAMSPAATGALDDGLEPDLERIVGETMEEAPRVGFLLHRAPREPGSDETLVWRIAASTVERVPELYARFGPGPVAGLLPELLLDTAFLDVYLWQWLGLIVALVLSYFSAWIAVGVVAWLARPLLRRSRSTLDDRMFERMTGPLRLATAAGAFAALIGLLELTVRAEVLFHDAVKVLVIAAATWLVFRIIDVLAEDTRRRLLERGQETVTYLIPTGTKALKLALGVLVVLSMLDTFGLDVTTLIAGLGVGGLAVALALQPTLENVFGGVAVLVDEPIRPGQFCRFGDKLGTVEEVGLRSTRVRTLDRTLISVPNAEFSNLQIENFAKRDRIRLTTTLGLRYETTADQLRHVMAELRRMLLAHPRVLPDPCRVRFVGFGSSSLDLEVFLYVNTGDYNEFLAIQEDLLLRVMDVVKESGTGFAFPSSTTYLARDGGLDAERTSAAEGAVRRWRTEGTLPFPDFAAQTQAELRGSLDWPPKGSPTAASKRT